MPAEVLEAQGQHVARVKVTLPILTEFELAVFLEAAFGIIIPRHQVCEGHTAPWRAFTDAYFARDSTMVWKASRGFGGKSFTLATLVNTEGATLKCDANVLGGSGEQSKRVLEHQDAIWKFMDAPRQLLASDPSQKIVRYKWGNTTKALMASTRSARGAHPPRLRLDEVDEMDYVVFEAVLGQTMAKRDTSGNILVKAQTVISSTHQYADKTMTKVLKLAAEKGWPVHEWCWRETLQPHGWNPPSEVERKRGDVPVAMWLAEYDLQEPSVTGRAIDTDKVEAAFQKALGEHRGGQDERIILEAPVVEGRYAIGADWARTVDWTVIVVIRYDIKPARVVAFLRTGRLPWPVMVGSLKKLVAMYEAKDKPQLHTSWSGSHDATGLGDVVDGYLPDDWTFVAEDDPEARPKMLGVKMVGEPRRALLSEYIAAIENGEIAWPRIEFAYAEHKYATVGDVYGGGTTTHLPDTMSAGALAWLAATSTKLVRVQAPVAVGAGSSYFRPAGATTTPRPGTRRIIG